MTQERKAFEVDCRYGQHRIMMVPQPEGKWKPYNLPENTLQAYSTPHNCRDQKNIAKQKPQQPGQEKMGLLSPAMEATFRKIVREEIEKWYSGTQVE